MKSCVNHWSQRGPIISFTHSLSLFHSLTLIVSLTFSLFPMLLRSLSLFLCLFALFQSLTNACVLRGSLFVWSTTTTTRLHHLALSLSHHGVVVVTATPTDRTTLIIMTIPVKLIMIDDNKERGISTVSPLTNTHPHSPTTLYHYDKRKYCTH